MFDIVISGGDSFTFGAEIDDFSDSYIPHEKSWANQVAQKIGKTHINVARSGRSNSFIVRHIIHQLAKIDLTKNKVFVQVMWTFTNRNEFAIGMPTGEYDSPWAALTPFSHIDETESNWFKNTSKSLSTWEFVYKSLKNRYEKDRQIGLVDFASQYNRLIQSAPLNDSYTSVKEVLLLQSFLENKKIPYIFTYVNRFVMEGLFHDAKRNPGGEYLNTARSLIKKENWYRFPGNFKFPGNVQEYVGFDDWARYSRYEYATSHPREPAHTDAADLIYNHIKNNFFE